MHFSFSVYDIPRTTVQGLSITPVAHSTPHSATSRSSLPPSSSSSYHPSSCFLTTYGLSGLSFAPPPFRLSLVPPSLLLSCVPPSSSCSCVVSGVACYAARACPQRPEEGEAPTTSPARFTIKGARFYGVFVHGRPFLVFLTPDRTGIKNRKSS